MNSKEKIDYISNWIKNYAVKNSFDSLIIGISGGIDSAVTSTLCAITNLKTFVVSMPILDHQVLNKRGEISSCKYLDNERAKDLVVF